MKLVTCATWIKQGVAKQNPEKVLLSQDELKHIIEDNRRQLRLKDVEDEANGIEGDKKQVINKKCKIADDDIIAIYGLDDYDDDDEDSTDPSVGLANLVVHISNEEDEHITLRDEDDQSEMSDDAIYPEDNLIAVGHVEDNCATLEIHVYNHQRQYFYVHHDILLPSTPMCLEWIDFDPSEQKSSNLVAVGCLTPVIEVWDIDMINCLEPTFQLGDQENEMKNKNKEILGHTSAILDLSWNKSLRTVLASGSADYSVILWDLMEGRVIKRIKEYSNNVQAVKWHPFEASILLTGSCDSSVKMFDCRNTNSASKTWVVEGEVERHIWNHFNPYTCFVTTSKGLLYQLDSRMTSPIWKIDAHEDACLGLQLSSQCSGLLVTACVDQTMKIWDVSHSLPKCVAEKQLNIGKIMCLQQCPDLPFVFCLGGDDRQHRFAVEDLMTNKLVADHFGKQSSIASLPFMSNDHITSCTNLKSSEISSSAFWPAKAKHPFLKKKFKQKKKTIHKFNKL